MQSGQYGTSLLKIGSITITIFISLHSVSTNIEKIQKKANSNIIELNTKQTHPLTDI